MAWNPKYKINLLDVFNRAYQSQPMELRNKLRPMLSSEAVKFLYGEFVIDEIVKNTTSGKDKNGNSMGTYKSKEYKESLQFKIYKGGKRSVDLKLTGDMLSDIKASQTKYTLVFGFTDQENRDKAQGHITGKYGKHGRTNKRDFFGLPKDTEEKLLKEVIKIQRQTDVGVTADLYSAALSTISITTGGGE